jgi:hypothetical protein
MAATGEQFADPRSIARSRSARGDRGCMGGRPPMRDDAEPPAGLRLYRATVCEHFVLECGRLAGPASLGLAHDSHP